ncbi:MAG TPA: phosphohydrolase, partial [Candidatus Synoicihabitans sp.]|nr:phosphohydrolase [Candidatus Synoicihabitans sp.]
MQFLEKSRLIAALIFIATVAAIVLVSFVGVNSLNVPVLPNQAAPVRIAASATFTYVSAEHTSNLREQIRDRVPPVFRLEFEPLRQFEANIRELLKDLESFEANYPADGITTPQAGEQFATIVDRFNAKGPYKASKEDVGALFRVGDADARRQIVEIALLVLREIYDQGVHDNTALTTNAATDEITVFQITGSGGDIQNRSVESLEDALTFLRINLAAEGLGRETVILLYRLFGNGVTPNLVYDQEATKRQQEAALASLKPVTITVHRGETIIEAGTRVTPEQYEMLIEHRKHLLETGGAAMDEGLQLFGRTLLVLAMVMACVFYIRLEDRETLQSNSRLGLLALVVMLNLTLVRATYALGGLPYFVSDSSAAALLPYLAPTALAPVIVAILIDAGSAVFMALLISIFTGVIYGNRLDLLVVTFLASMVAIFTARQTRKRGSIVRATTFGGVVVLTFALLIGVIDRLPPLTVFKQMIGGLVTGILTGIVVVGLLPLLES